MSEPLSAVVAGSKGFVDAVQGHLKMRFGAAPLVARDPQEALRACADKGSLLVLEYAGSAWLEAVKSVRGLRGDAALSIVAAVPLAQAADVQPLQRAGVDEVVSWQGRADPVMWAVDRIVDRQTAQRNAALLPVPDPPKEGEIETGFEIRELTGEDASTNPTPVPILSCVPRPAANPAAPALVVPWPTAVPGAAGAEALLLSVSAGQGSGTASELAAAERVLASSSELERAALSGAEVPVDPALLRATAGLRLRLDLALSTLPAAEDAVDQPAAQQLLVEVDGVLAQLKALAASAPAGVAPALEPIKFAIVDGGVKLAAALSELVPLGEQQASAAPGVKKRNAARLLSNESDVSSASDAKRATSRHIALAVMLAAAVAFAGIYHARHFATRPALKDVAESGMPANMFVVSEVRGQKLLSSLDGRPPSADALERYRQLERARGNEVETLGPTMLSVRAAKPAAGPLPGR